MSATSDGRTALAAAEADTCLLCGGQRFDPYLGGGSVPPVSPASESYRITHSERRLVHAIVRCAACGMVNLPLHYAVPATYTQAADPYYLEQAGQRIANAHRLLSAVPAGGRLLEIGCACGFLLVAARERGFAVQGVEMSAWATAYARDTYGLDVKTGALETLSLPPTSYDVVVLADVVEHLVDPRVTLRHIHRILRPGGRVLLLTPDIGSVMARVLGARWWGLLDDHYFYFSRQTLVRLLEQEGFAVERIRALGRVFPVSHWLYKLAPYNRRLQEMATALARALRLDRLQLSINLGDQMACVARKK